MTTSIFNGNCLELMKTLPDKSIDLFICDLPYGETNCKWDSIIDLDEFWAEFRRLRKSKRVACIHFCSTKFGYTIIKSWEKGFKMDLVWKKRNKTGGLQSRHRPMRNHEMVYFFYEQAPKYNRDKYHKRIKTFPAKKENGKNGLVYDNKGVSIKESGFSLNFDPKLPSSVVEEEENDTIYSKKGWKMGEGFSSKDGNRQYLKENPGYTPRQPGSVFDSEKVFIGKRHHQTEKPLDILEFFLKYWSDEGDTILDPTMGSGSTGVACKNLNRNFIGYELDPKIFEVAKGRLGIQEEVVEI